MKRKKKKCQYSKCPCEDKYFTPRFSTTEKTHFNYLCQKGYLDEFNSEKEINKRHKELKTAVKKDKKSVYNYLQDEVNTIVRIIDYMQECGSCDKKGGTFFGHAGHVISVGENPTLRYNLLVNYLQCSQCNTHKHGNEAKYLLKLKRTFGQGLVDEIDALQSHPPLHLNKVEAKEKLGLARKIVYELKKRGELIYSQEHRIELRREINKTLGIYQDNQKAA